MPKEKRRPIDERFEDFNKANPLIFQLFLRFARAARTAGQHTFSAKRIIEQIRWEVIPQGPGDSGFRINNDFTSRYARLAVRLYPDEFGNFFTFRALQEDE